MKKEKLTTAGMEFYSTIPIQVRFNDIDALGHINNNIYLSYFDLAKADYLESIKGTGVSWIEGAIVIAHLEMDFLLPTFYKENISVDSKIVHIGDKSAVFMQQLRNTDTNDIKCICQSVFVYIDIDKQIPAPIPYVWKEAMGKYEKIEF